jgi:hypothetical protein
MKRITLRYGGMVCTLGDVDLDDLKARIFDAQTSGSPTWLRVA